MALCDEAFLALVAPRSVFYFSSYQIDTLEPHYFICIAVSPDDDTYLLCCTSQLERNLKILRQYKFPDETLVWIAPHPRFNSFTKDTYVNCNRRGVVYTKQALLELYRKGELKVNKPITRYTYRQIIVGLQASPRLNPEVRDVLPKLDDL